MFLLYVKPVAHSEKKTETKQRNNLQQF